MASIEPWLLENGSVKQLTKEARHGHGHSRTAHNKSASSLRRKSDMSLVSKVPCATLRIFLANLQEVILGTKLAILFIAIPFAIAAQYLGFARPWVFSLSLIGLMPLAERVSFLTEQIAFYTGPTVGGLLNATCGNATELIISIFALMENKVDVVKYSLLGSILSNLLLVLGTSLLCGGIANVSVEQKFDRKQADVNIALLLLGLLCHVLPLMYRYAVASDASTAADVLSTATATLNLSRVSCIVMLIAYLAYLVFQLWTHRHIFEGQEDENDDGSDDETPVVGLWSGIIWLIGMTAIISLLSEFLVDTIEEVYVMSYEGMKTSSRTQMPRDKYPKPLVFHDGRLAFLPTPLATVTMILWFPFGILLAIIRLCAGAFLPYKVSILVAGLTGVVIRVNGCDYQCKKKTKEGKGGGVLFVCTHRTLLDPVILTLIVNKPLTAVTYSISRMSEIISPIKTVRVTRDRKKDEEIMNKLLCEGDLIICPEGTTCREPYLLRFSSLFAELTDEIVPVAMNTDVTMFYGTTAGGLKWLDPFYFLMNPRPTYHVQVLEKLAKGLTCGLGNKSSHEVANHIQKQLAHALGFECTKLTRRDKYLMLVGNQGVVDDGSKKTKAPFSN